MDQPCCELVPAHVQSSALVGAVRVSLPPLNDSSVLGKRNIRDQLPVQILNQNDSTSTEEHQCDAHSVPIAHSRWPRFNQVYEFTPVFFAGRSLLDRDPCLFFQLEQHELYDWDG